jgi:hypothetical protein
MNTAERVDVAGERLKYEVGPGSAFSCYAKEKEQTYSKGELSTVLQDILLVQADDDGGGLVLVYCKKHAALRQTNVHDLVDLDGKMAKDEVRNMPVYDESTRDVALARPDNGGDGTRIDIT